jgi:hypothetical protein
MKKRYYIVPVVMALAMSIVSSRWLFVGSGLSLIPWGILAVLSGLFAKNKHDALWLGAIYGFSQAFIFLWIDKAGKTSLTQFLLLCIIITGLALIAALFAGVASQLVFAIKTKRG